MAGRAFPSRPAAPRTPAASASTTWSRRSRRSGHTAPRRDSPPTSSTSHGRFSPRARAASAVAIASDGRAARCPRPSTSPATPDEASLTVTSLPDAKGSRPEHAGAWTADGTSFRDLNGNGELDPYEDPRLPVEERVDDLLGRMTLEEKAAQLFHQGLLVPDDGAVGDEPDGFSPVATRALVAELGLTHFNIYWAPGPVHARRVAQPDAGGGGGHAARDPGHDLVRPAARPRRQPRHEHGRRGVLQVAGPDRAGRDTGRGSRARVRRRRRDASTSPSGSASRCIRPPISRPSRAGAVRRERSARTPSSRRGW